MLFNLDPATLISRSIVLIIAFTVHEFAHAWSADQFGDDTPRVNGRLTLNPLAHLDPIGSLLLLVAGFGWAKPVPINPFYLQRRAPSATMWVALAGPFSNLIMAILAAIPFRLGLVSGIQAQYDVYFRGSHLLPSFAQIMWEFVAINLVLMLFNLIPLAPLDGEKIADYFLPPSWGRVLDAIRPYGPIILMAVFFVGPMLNINVIGWIIGRPLQTLMNLLIG
ncbi:MAG: site-2 protease family protein [Chloroflexota bacterium]|nr:MAG: site-2 protease family protein [Chloroflexota bacterium]